MLVKKPKVKGFGGKPEELKKIKEINKVFIELHDHLNELLPQKKEVEELYKKLFELESSAIRFALGS